MTHIPPNTLKLHKGDSLLLRHARLANNPSLNGEVVPKAAILQQFLRKDRTVLPANKKQDLPQANYKKGRDKPIVMSLYRPVVKKTTVNFKAQVNEDSTTLKSAATPVPIVLTLPTFQQQEPVSYLRF